MAPPMKEFPDLYPSEVASELRDNFMNKYAGATGKANVYDGRDLERIKNSDDWLQAFLRHQKGIVENAAKMMDVSLRWRKEFGVNDVQESEIPLDILQKGGVYYHNKNNTNCDILYFKIKESKRGDARLSKYSRQLIALHIERHQRSLPNEKIVAFLDMTDVGLINVDIDLTKFLITCFTTYFPGVLEYLLVYDMPWIINAVWTIVKQLLSEEEQKHVIFCKKMTVQQYVDKSQLFPHMGGTDTHVFRYVPCDDSQDDEDTTTYQETEAVDDHTETADEPDGKAVATRKKVNFAAENEVKEFIPLPEENSTGAVAVSSTVNPTGADSSEPRTTQTGTAPSPKHMAMRLSIMRYYQQWVRTFKDTVQPRSCISPQSELKFTRQGINHEASCSITVTNPHSSVMAFKVKTTDPKNYRVKPSGGVLSPNASETVQVVLLSGKEIKRDKFLLLSLKIKSSDLKASEISNVWRNALKGQIHEHKLRCHEELIEHADISAIGDSYVTSLNTSTISKINQGPIQSLTEKRLELLQGDVDRMMTMVKACLALLIVILSLLLYNAMG